VSHDETDMLLIRRIKTRESKYWQLKYRCPECGRECSRSEIPAVASTPTCTGSGLKLLTAPKETVAHG
jgi:DNA-directed RNA polymerase subunit RPC12/RpoP